MKLEDALKSLEEKNQADTASVVDAQNHFQAVSAGLSSNDDGEEKTLTDQLMGKTLEYHLSRAFKGCWVKKLCLHGLSKFSIYVNQ